MKQILQSLKTGVTEVADVPTPGIAAGQLLIQTRASLVSAGTERMLKEFGQANWIAKARQQPDKVKMVLEKARTDGVLATMEAVQSKIDQPLALGYCNVGEVVGVGSGVTGFAAGDRVVSNGKHAEMISVPRNLCARIPDGVSDENASFTVLAAIGLQGIRLANPSIGECVVVTGLGLIGLLTVQMLRAHGCRVLGIDFDAARLDMARAFGAEVVDPSAGDDVQAVAAAFSRGNGVDAVIITASTKSSDPVSQAAHMCRKRGRIVLVGVTGLELSRADFYEKELSFQVSCSYGPGRYDDSYEQGGQDYPIGFVRWTEQRNFEAVLDLMASGGLNVPPLISHRFPLERAEDAFGLLTSGEASLGIMLQYGADRAPSDLMARRVALSAALPPASASIGFLGAGNYAGRVLIPAFKAAGAQIHTLVSASGVSAVHFGRKFDAAGAGTDSDAVIADPLVDTIVVATRHDAHARQIIDALEAGKNVFCEKPLCLTLEELSRIEALAAARPAQRLMVGFNRRFAPQVVRMKALLDRVAEPKCFIMTVNAGAIPADHWTQDPLVGGGRIIGEACHFIDLLRHLAGADFVGFDAHVMGDRQSPLTLGDNVTITLAFADGSTGTIHYLANGNKSFPKERLEVFCGGRILQLDNFRKLRGWGWRGFARMNLWRQDKGQFACVKAFVDAIRDGGATPIPIDEIIDVSRVTLQIAQLARG